MVRLFTSAALALGLLAMPAVATSQSPSQAQINATLMGDASIWDALFALALADELRNTCTHLEARTLRATSFVYDVYGQARAYGYSRQQIRAFQVDDDTEVQMRARVTTYFAENGVRAGAPETYCTLGRAEISAGTAAGNLLRAR